MPFNYSLVINYLNALLNLVDGDEMDRELHAEVLNYLDDNYHEWDISETPPEAILEIFILEACVLGRFNSMDGVDEIEAKYYIPLFHKTFFDPDPQPRMSVSGWLNFNYARQHEEATESLPLVTFQPLHDIVTQFVDAAPTADEMLPEYIQARFIESFDNEDRDSTILSDNSVALFNGEISDLSYELLKCFRGTYHSFVALNNAYPDELPLVCGQLLITETLGDLQDTFEFVDPLHMELHPLSLVLRFLEIQEESHQA